MIKLSKKQLEKLSAMPTLETWQKERFAKHPEDLPKFKKSVLASYQKDPSMSEKELIAILRDIAQMEGYTKFAQKAKLAREHVYRAVSPGANPRLSTLVKLADACGLRIGFYLK